MGSFYFNVRDGETLTRDPKPYLFSTVEIARDSAIRVVRELFNERAGDDSLDDRRIEISDETGHPLSFVNADDVRSNKPGMRTRESGSAPLRELEI